MVDPRFKTFRYISAVVLFITMLFSVGFLPAVLFSFLVWSTTQPRVLRWFLPAKFYDIDGSPKLWVTEFAAPALMVATAFLLLLSGFVFLSVVTVTTAVIDVCRDSIPVRRLEEKVRDKTAGSEIHGNEGPVEDAEFTEKHEPESDQTQDSE